MKELQELPVWLWIVLAAAVMLQGTCLFLHARDRGQGWKAWFWGIWGLTVVPTPALCYLLFVVLPDNRKRKAGRNR